MYEQLSLTEPASHRIEELVQTYEPSAQVCRYHPGTTLSTDGTCAICRIVAPWVARNEEARPRWHYVQPAGHEPAITREAREAAQARYRPVILQREHQHQNPDDWRRANRPSWGQAAVTVGIVLLVLSIGTAFITAVS